MAKIINNDNETIEIATDEDVYIPVASTQNVGVAKFNSKDFAVSQDGLVTSLQKVGGVQYFGTIVSQSEDGSILKWKLVEESDDNTDYPKVGAKILLKEDFEGIDRIYNAGEVYVITSIDNYDVSERTPVYTSSEYFTSYKGDTATIKVHSTTTLTAGSNATVVNVGTNEAAQLNFGIPGSPTVEVDDTVIPLAPATTPIVTNVGDEYAVKLQFSIPTTQKITGTNLKLLNTWEEGSIEINEEQSTDNELVLDFNIPRGYPGQSFHIDDQVYTTGDLPAATEENIGRVYVVGESVPYDMYVCIYDEETSTYQWLSLGHIIGIKNVEKVSAGLVDTYTVTMDDGYSFQFTITNGANGDTGIGLKSVIEYYLATLANTGVTTSTSGWTTNVSEAVMNATNRYLWNYEYVEYTDGTNSSTEPVIIGTYGSGIASVTEYYGISTSSSTEPTSWYTTPQLMTGTYRYLWNYEVIAYDDGTSTTTDKVVIGVYGEKGDTGDTGDTGADGQSYYWGEYNYGHAPALGVVYSVSYVTWYNEPTVSSDADTVPCTLIWHDTSTGYTYLCNCVYGADTIVVESFSKLTGETGDTGDAGADGNVGPTIYNIYLYHTGTTGTDYSGMSYSYSSALTAGWYTEPSGVTADTPYEYVLIYTCTVTYDSEGNVTSTSYEPSYTTPVIWAKYGADGEPGDSAAVTAQNIYNALTEDDTIYGCFWETSEETDDDGNAVQVLYIKAEYIKGTYITSDISWTGNLIATNIDVQGGTVGPFTVTSSYLSTNGKASYSSSTSGVYIGSNGIGLGASTFYVTRAGKLYASNADISGTITATSGEIAGFTLSDSSLYTGSKTSYDSTESGVYIGTDGIGIGAGTFYVGPYGGLVATNADITGKVNATSGTFTNVTVSATCKIGNFTVGYVDSKGQVTTDTTYSALYKSGAVSFGETILKYYDGASSYMSYAYFDCDGVGYLKHKSNSYFYPDYEGDFSYEGLVQKYYASANSSGTSGTLTDSSTLGISSLYFYHYGDSTEYSLDIGWSSTNKWWNILATDKLYVQASTIRLQGFVDVYGDMKTYNIYPYSYDPDESDSSENPPYCGTSSNPWYEIAYYHTNNLSDRSLKQDIEELPEEYTTLFDNLIPVRYKYIKLSKDGYHTGFIAQDVEEAISAAGLQNSDFACYRYDERSDLRGLDYPEIIALCVNEIQKLKSRVATLEKE